MPPIRHIYVHVPHMGLYGPRSFEGCPGGSCVLPSCSNHKGREGAKDPLRGARPLVGILYQVFSVSLDGSLDADERVFRTDGVGDEDVEGGMCACFIPAS